MTVGSDLNDIRFGKLYEIESVHVHELYDSDKIQNDIALLKTTEPIQFSDEVQPICLPEKDYGIDNQYECETSGFGRISWTGNIKIDSFFYTTFNICFFRKNREIDEG